MIGKICLIYIDDILVFGKDEIEHDRNVAIVENRLKEYGLEEKRASKVGEIDFLGYHIGYGRINPTTKRSQGIKDYKVPTSKKEVQRFLGFVNYDRMFVEHIADLLKLLYELTRKEYIFDWTNKEQQIFDEIKNKLSSKLEFTMPEFGKEFVLEIDASDTGLVGVLKQEGKPIVYISRSLRKHEQQCSITEKEVLAAMWAMEKLEFYLLVCAFN